MSNSFYADGEKEAIKKLRIEEQVEIKLLRKESPFNIVAILKIKLKYRRLKDECINNLYLKI
jgi:hypothetical protein